MSQGLPSFDLVVATVDRTEELARFLESVAAQGAEHVRVIIVDQNADARLDSVLEAAPLRIERIAAPRGLSRARNAGLGLIEADIVAFPDDDCVYPPGLLVRVGKTLAADTTLDGVSGRSVNAQGESAASWKSEGALLTDDNLWNRVISFSVFLRRDVVDEVGHFDEELGLGSGTPWASGEEIDYLVRAIRSGARIAYDPSLLVEHEIRSDNLRLGARDGASIGYVLRKHHYPVNVVLRMLVRPVGGALVSSLRLDAARRGYHLATLRGRVRGYRGAKRSNSSV